MNKVNEYMQEADEDFQELYSAVEEGLLTVDRALLTKGFVRVNKDTKEELLDLKQKFDEVLSLIDDHIRGDKP